MEEIGSVYQTVMGFRLEVAAAPSIAIKGKAKKGGVAALTVINLSALLVTKSSDRSKWLKERTDQELTGEAYRALKSAATIDDLLAALDCKIARNATPQLIPQGGVVLQPNDERRRSGSHYTPRSFTEPIVHTNAWSTATANPNATSATVRSELVEALRPDLVGPANDHAFANELLRDSPRSWYLTGFLVPSDAPAEQRTDELATDEIDSAGEGGNGSDDDNATDKAAARRSFLPSSMGLSVLVDGEVSELMLRVSWGDYAPEGGTTGAFPEEDSAGVWMNRFTGACPRS